MISAFAWLSFCGSHYYSKTVLVTKVVLNRTEISYIVNYLATA